jgi:hypothetical protein
LQLEGLGKLKKFNCLIRNQTGNLPACSIVPHPITLPQTNLNEVKEEMTARMETRIDANNEKLKGLQSTFMSQMDIHQVRTEAIQEEIIAQMDAHQERLGASVSASQEGMTTCQEVTEACLESKELTSLEIESIVVHEEVSKKEATVQTVRALKKHHGDWHLALGHYRKPKKWTHANGESWKKLASACRGMTCCAIPAPPMGHDHQ